MNNWHSELIDKLQYIFVRGVYQEIDALIAALHDKNNFEDLCEKLFRGCSIADNGYLVPGGFFTDENCSASLQYVMYELLSRTPDTFLLKHRVTRVKFVRSRLNGAFRFPSKLFSLPRLQALTVRDMGINQLPTIPNVNKTITVIDLEGNEIGIFPDGLLRLPNLSILNLAYNKIEELPSALCRLKRLRVLSLKGNVIGRIPEDWHRMQNLRVLDLSMNRLKVVPDSLCTLGALKDLRLSFNDLPASIEAYWERSITKECKRGQNLINSNVSSQHFKGSL
ncbi:hypothetical protein S1OALGB6SA_1325 [Olavius algarvensis spirochete endosymbiont]|uniref:leucine-rich repeat domain-containing protein n=1 Tax=Olavius algarvensis spirochete endosymbiont TaxID=260710 RepID=UPI000F2CDEF8|nr:leucine-rich repeat domain-containing protein [Olavius algarvensis spirochete endosymbiont]VDB00250.1 hypothetical protein S1OALGB6SA_1325 [Olavius algarvensis spirochete endosymbiont]